MAKSQNAEIAQLEAAIHAALISQSRRYTKARRTSAIWAGFPAISALEGALCLTALLVVGIVLKVAVPHIGFDLPLWPSH
jgi:hypothetical protein